MKQFLFFLLFILATTQLVLSQNSIQAQRWVSIDSLLNDPSTEDSTIAKNYLLIAKLVIYSNIDSSELFLEKAKQTAEEGLGKVKHNNEKVNLLRVLGRTEFYIGSMAHMNTKYERAKQQYKKAIEIQKECNDKVGLTKTYNFLSRLYEREGNKKAFFELNKKAMRIQEELKDTVGYATSSVALGAYYELESKPDSSIMHYQDAVDLLRKTDQITVLAFAIYEYSNALKRLGKLEKAITLLYEVLQIHEKDNNSYRKITTMMTIGQLFQKLGKLNKAEEYFNKAQTINERQGHKELQAKLLSNFGSLYNEKKEYRKGLYYSKQAIKLADSLKLGNSSLTLLFMGLGEQYKKINEIDTAIYYFEKASSLSEGYSSSTTVTNLYNTLSESYLQKNNIPKAQKYALNSAKISEKVELSESLMKANSLLSAIYEKSGDFKKALIYMKLANHLKDSLGSINNKNLLVEKEAEFQIEKKEQEILTLEKEQELQELKVEKQKAELVQQKQYLTLLVLGLMLIASISLLFFNRYKLKQQNERLVLETSQLEMEKKQEQTYFQLEMAELRSDFFTNISHEFRTPLTLILNPLESLMEKTDLPYRKKIEKIYDNASNLLLLINETLDLSRLENGQLPMLSKSFLIGNYIERIAESFSSLAQKQQVNLEVVDRSEQCEVFLDDNKMKKVFTNLLANAFKYTDECGEVSVLIDPPSESFVSIHIKDTGSGIHEKDIPFIFDRFYQARNNNEGTGLGLALSRQLVEIHNGTIEVESEPGKGSVFTVTIPLKQEKTLVAETVYLENNDDLEKDKPSESKLTKGERKSVLIVEDNHDLRTCLKDLLKNEYNILLAENGQEGIEVAKERSPDLIISDIMMPYKDGLQLTQFLKSNLATSHIPIILLTAKATIDNKMKGLQEGADDYLTKPFNSRELRQRVENLLVQRDKLKALFSTNYFITPRKVTKSKIDQNFLEKAVSLVEGQLSNADYTVEQFCQDLAYNRSGVHLKLKALTGQNTSQFIKSIRLRKVAELIQTTTLNINEVVEQCGFGSRQTFNKAFKTQFGMTPSDFRNCDDPIPNS